MSKFDELVTARAIQVGYPTDLAAPRVVGSDLVAEIERLRAENAKQQEKLTSLRDLIDINGCYCSCECDPDEHNEDCDLCWCCEVSAVIGPGEGA